MGLQTQLQTRSVWYCHAQASNNTHTQNPLSLPLLPLNSSPSIQPHVLFMIDSSMHTNNTSYDAIESYEYLSAEMWNPLNCSKHVCQHISSVPCLCDAELRVSVHSKYCTGPCEGLETSPPPNMDAECWKHESLTYAQLWACTTAQIHREQVCFWMKWDQLYFSAWKFCLVLGHKTASPTGVHWYECCTRAQKLWS